MVDNIFLMIALSFLQGAKIDSIPREQIVVYAEYSINSIPDTGQGIPITITPGQSTPIQIDNLPLNVGDVVYIRVKTSPTGLWGAPKGIKYLKHGEIREVRIVAAEYFIGPDPGEGNGTPISMTMGTIVPLEFSVDTTDIVRIRVKDALGQWSSPMGRKFRMSTIRDAEYFVKRWYGDTLPVTPLKPWDGAFDGMIEVGVDTISLDGGFRDGDTVFVRFQNDDYRWSPYAIATELVGVEEEADQHFPKVFNLHQNSPNPFHSTTSIQYAVAKPTTVNLRIYNVAGQVVRTLANAPQKPGYYTMEWDGRDENGQMVAPGVYFYRLETEQFKNTKKLILVR